MRGFVSFGSLRSPNSPRTRRLGITISGRERQYCLERGLHGVPLLSGRWYIKESAYQPVEGLLAKYWVAVKVLNLAYYNLLFQGNHMKYYISLYTYNVSS